MQIYVLFTSINNYKLYLSINNTGNKYCETDQKPQKNLSDLFDEFNNFSDQNKNQENVSNCKYYDLNEIKPLNKLNNKSSFSLFHINSYRNKAPINHIDLANYSYEHGTGGTLLYIRNDLSYKTRNYLNIYKSAELESTFVEIINHKKSNILVGSIYRHPLMDLNEFNDYYLNKLLHKLSSENKSVILLGDFNVDLMKYDNHHSKYEFLDFYVSSSY